MSKETESVTVPTVEISPQWRNPDGKKVSQDDVFQWVSNTKLDRDNEYQVIVGTDSHMHGRQFRFITVICALRVGKGGYYYYQESYEPRDRYVLPGRGKKVKGNQKMRMFNEVERSVAMAEDLFDKTGVLAVVHIDASPSSMKEFTSEFSDELRGYATGQGFEAVIKPDSFVSSCVADKYTK